MAPKPPETLGQAGTYLDGWADLIPNFGQHVDQVREATNKYLVDRKMPDIDVWETTPTPTRLQSHRRRFLAATTAPGTTTSIFIGEHGKDLYVSWRTFMRPVLNWIAVAIGVGIPFLIALGSPFFQDMRDFGVIGITEQFIALLLVELILLAFAQGALKINVAQLFIVQPTWFDAEDITAISMSAHQALQYGLEAVGVEQELLRPKENFTAGRPDLRI